MGVTEYGESLASRLYPGNTLSQHVLPSSVQELERLFPLSWAKRRSTCLRMDAGFGTDTNLDWLLQRDYQLLAKSLSGSRAGIWGKRISDWQTLETDRRWIALPEQQLHFCRPTRTLALRWLDMHGKLKHALYVVTDLHTPMVELAQRYDLRGGFEVDIREDKQGLLLTHRRKRLWGAQETLVLLNDLAHNFLIMFRRQFLQNTPFEKFGIYRLIHELLAVPGHAVLDHNGFLCELRLLHSHPHAKPLVDILAKLWQ